MRNAILVLPVSLMLLSFAGCNVKSIDLAETSLLSASISQKDRLEEQTVMEQKIFYVTVGGKTFTAVFADNPGADALKELLTDGPVTIDMEDYGGFEKVGALGQELPSSNSRVTTQTGDIVLYQENQIVMFYGSNAWSYTRLGKIEDLTGWEDALGSGNISVSLSLTEPHL